MADTVATLGRRRVDIERLVQSGGLDRAQHDTVTGNHDEPDAASVGVPGGLDQQGRFHPSPAPRDVEVHFGDITLDTAPRIESLIPRIDRAERRGLPIRR
ncbi:hypothetical protein ACQPYE_27360 [Actinosynnema sp. CA-299493]